MPIVTSDDVLTGVLAYWQSSSIKTALPGGISHQRPANAAVYPLGVMKIVEGERERFSGRHYIQPFTVTITIETKDAPSNSGALVGQLRSLFDDWQTQPRASTLTIPHADSVVCVKPVPGALEYAPEQKDAQNMVIGRAAWEILVQASY